MFKKSAAPAAAASGYTIAKSLRFRSSASAYLNRTPSSTGNRQIFTWSGWVKRGKLGTYQSIFNAAQTLGSNNNTNEIAFTSSDTLDIFGFASGTGTIMDVNTTQVFRDPSAWYHIVVAIDTTQVTAANRVKVYVNGTQVTSFGTATYPSQNYNLWYNTSGYISYIGAWSGGSGGGFVDAYMAEMNFVDGQQLTPTSFGSFNSTTGVWQPIAYTGTYGTNGFYLKFTDTSSTAALGTDYSGNSNTWTTNNFSLTAGSTYDSMTDVPTLTSATVANYATLNPIFTNTGASNTFYYGNLELASNSNSVNAFSPSTISMTSGKFYFETTAGVINAATGMTASVNKLPILNGTNFYSQTNYRYFSADGKVYSSSGAVQNYSTYTNNDVIGVALDLDNGKVFFSKNGTWQGSSDPAAGTNPAATGLTGEWVFGLNVGTTSSDYAFANFGQQGFTYTPPTGFVALNTYNLPTSTVVQGNKYMDATTYAGDGTSPKSQTNTAGFKPDLVWIKDRTNAYSHNIYDSVRGTGSSKDLQSDNTNSESTNATNAAAYGYLSAFNSNGFSTTNGTDPSFPSIWVNASSNNYVAWQWQAGQGSTSSNTNGSITSTVSVNATAGFSIVTYAGNGTTGTVGHGLGTAPKFIIVKNRGATSDWATWSSSLSSGYYILLNTTAAQSNSSAPFVFGNNVITVDPTSSVFTVGSGYYVNSLSTNYVAYCWTAIPGFSSFGSYTGNGSSDGPFVYTGFRPKFILLKDTTNANNWQILDSSRNTYNVANSILQPNLSDAESAFGVGGIDFLSNGFKIKTSSTSINTTSAVVIYAAFAENPFKNALAR